MGTGAGASVVPGSDGGERWTRMDAGGGGGLRWEEAGGLSKGMIWL